MAANSTGSAPQLTASTFSVCSSNKSDSKCDVSISNGNCSSENIENFIKFCSPRSPTTTSKKTSFTKSPSQSMKNKHRKKCKDLSHYNSVPPLGHMPRSSSSTYLPTVPLKSPTDVVCPPKSPKSHTAPKSPSEHPCGPRSPRSINAPKSPSEHTNGPKSPKNCIPSKSPDYGGPPRSPRSPRSPKYPPKSPTDFTTEQLKSPHTPTTTHFNFPPSPSLTMKSPGTSKQRKFSFGGSKSPKGSKASQSNLRDGKKIRSPSTDSERCPSEEECSTKATSLSRPTSPRGLAYLASRRGSRESQMSNEDLAPLNFTNTTRGRQRRTSNFLELPVPDHIRPRVCSLPEKPYNPRSGDELYRLRTFSITNKGVVNYGDSIINRRSKSNTSVNSTASRHSNHSNVSNNSPWEGSCCGSSYNNVSTETSGEDVTKYRVVMLGDSGVGKTALVSQFMTSEYMNTYDASLDDEFGEKTVSILLDGEESEMVFIDHPSSEMSVENSLSTYEPHACVVVYSVVHRTSFKTAEDILNYLWRENYTHDKSVIVVGNKADLARARVITTNEGKCLAASRDCKFIETSSGIQHNVDELLVGILKQIRLRESRDKKKQRRGVKRLHGSKTSLSLNIAREILYKMCLTDGKSKSCENLHVL